MKINRISLTRITLALFISGFLFSCEGDPLPETEVIAKFRSGATMANTRENISFTDESTGNPITWSWTFEGGTPATSTDQNPMVTYLEVGVYDVTLTVTNKVSENTLEEEEYITVVKDVTPDFTTNTTQVLEGASIEFTDASTGDPTEWSWTFEGGAPASSQEQNPVVQYNKPGVYSVSLSISNGSTSNSIEKERIIYVTCEGSFCEPVFSAYIKTEDIVYGVNPDGHKMIIYEAEGDTRTDRPIVVLMGGGGFGGPNLSLLEPLAINLVRYGAVVALIKYRVINTTDGTTKLVSAQQDCRAAVRYLRKEANNLNLASDQIFIGGYGSGAFAALFHAYIDESDLSSVEIDILDGFGGLEGEDQGNSSFSSEVAGVVSLAGGMYNSIESITNQDVPIYAIHGTADSEVPYDFQAMNPVTYGSKSIVDKVESVGLASHLFSIVNGSHSAPRERSDDYILELMYFIRDIIQ